MTPRCLTRSTFFRRLLCGVLLFSAVFAGQRSFGQAARATASRTSDLVAYGGYSFVQPDYGQAGTNNNGYLLGAAYMRYLGHFRHELGVGLDIRYNRSHGQTVLESVYNGNIRIQTTYGQRFHPYAIVGYGFGTIHFDTPPHPGYSSDNGPVTAGGGGVNVDIVHNFSAKADYQFQAWKLGTSYHIDPSVYNFGVEYRIPFHPWVSHGHERD